MNKLTTLSVFFIILISMIAMTNESASDRTSITNDSLEAEKQMYVDVIMETTVKGKEKLPADSVFIDIQILKGVPAERIPGIMSAGFSKALGVGCDHCHNVTDFASNEKPEKQIAREMMGMSGQIREMLSNIKEITSENPVVNCMTCHRGEIIPATKME